MNNSFTVIIPARYGSTRFPGKPLVELAGRPMIEHVYRRACASGAERVLVATDDERIAAACDTFGADVVMTRSDHPSGTDRLAEVVERERLPDDAIVVNLQGDEPMMPPSLVRQAASALAERPQADIATLATAIRTRDEVFDPNAVKLVRDHLGFALYFSRAPIPWDRDGFARSGEGKLNAGYLRHLGLYAYRVDFLRRYPRLDEVDIETAECLEQLRALWHGAKIYVDIAGEMPPPGIDTPADLERVRKALANAGN
ncbi:3-deoxy-manno-octulosonate cytidylyltransferase [Alkalilimnicola ehrlichii]|uniref:3-deoxy-manno-octulosonate cytidylyltransferase n=1 Tax=Alkalilimnicola ehrlichii TaxID=351052 RepID=A0A3E0WLE8_9GAMM|nr:3-deoxy-manno-octulosonate cytidylyltransferase [Alkalilimnicola ehrlichii]RFA24551.1 3-deoxy-manno-octulosonate cytidylyltransferase [Alkalilimnicola ehrlichii]RFA33782.1 3-deoxy-manno-octulosonate cytidylyltransferase [Alkalilimnicola ehrlichii]